MYIYITYTSIRKRIYILYIIKSGYIYIYIYRYDIYYNVTDILYRNKKTARNKDLLAFNHASYRFDQIRIVFFYLKTKTKSQEKKPYRRNRISQVVLTPGIRFVITHTSYLSLRYREKSPEKSILRRNASRHTIAGKMIET